MRVLTVYAHHNARSFCHAVLEQFTQGLEDAGHESEVVDLYAIKFNPVYGERDSAFFAHESVPLDIWDESEFRQRMVASSGGPSCSRSSRSRSRRTCSRSRRRWPPPTGSRSSRPSTG